MLNDRPCATDRVLTCMSTAFHECQERVLVVIQPIADSVAQNLEMMFKNYQFSTRRTRIRMGFINTMIFGGTNHKSHRQNSGSLKSFTKNLKILCHLICNRLYVQ